MNIDRQSGTFYTEYIRPKRLVGNWRDELERSMLRRCTNPVMLSLSSGLDSQILLVSLIKLNIPFTAVYLDLTGHNLDQLSRIKELESKWGFNTEIVTIDPCEIQTRILEEAIDRKIPPNHLVHREFLSRLDKTKDFMIGLEGPDIILDPSTGNRLIMEAFNSFENTRLRVLNEVQRPGKVINLDKDPTDDDGLLTSILNDDIFQSFVECMPYVVNNGLRTSDGNNLRNLWTWNYYIKPLFMGKYWGNKLTYWSKQSGIETINWLANCKIEHNYSVDVTYIRYTKLVNFLISGKDDTVRLYSKF